MSATARITDGTSIGNWTKRFVATHQALVDAAEAIAQAKQSLCFNGDKVTGVSIKVSAEEWRAFLSAMAIARRWGGK